MARYWADDAYWTEALDRYYDSRDAGNREITVNIAAMEKMLFDGDSPAYRLMEAMVSVEEHEGMDGHRGAPRLVMALLQLLSENERQRD